MTLWSVVRSFCLPFATYAVLMVVCAFFGETVAAILSLAVLSLFMGYLWGFTVSVTRHRTDLEDLRALIGTPPKMRERTHD